MALNDVMPLATALGGHTRIVHYPVTGSQTFYIGDLLKLSSGLLVIGTDEPVAQSTSVSAEAGLLIAAENSFTTSYPNGVATNTSKAAGTLIACYLMLPGDSVLCKLYSTDAGGTAADITPSAIRGTSVGFVVDGSTPKRWFVDSHVNTNKVGIIDDVILTPQSASGFQRQSSQSSSVQATGTFQLIVRIARDVVAGSA